MSEPLDPLDPLAALFGDGVRVATSPLIYGIDDLLEEERVLCARAVLKRQREVAAGRVLAHRVLSSFGVERAPLLNTPDRAPIWPSGFTGSISHANDLCAVAVAPSSAVRALGLDVEMRTPLEHDLFKMVLVDAEARWLAQQPASERGELAKLIFSAKECAYKAQYPLTKKMLEFSEVSLAIDLHDRSFEASVLPGVRGFFVLEERHLITGMRVPITY